MEHKKKYPGGLKVLLFPLFIMLLGMFSTCYAGTTLTEPEAEYIWNYNFTNEYSNLYGYLSGYSSYTRTMFTDYTDFMTFFNENNTLDINENNTWFIVTWQGNNWGYIDYYNFNNTSASDSSPYLTINFPSGSSNPKIMAFYAYDDTSKTYVDLVGRRFKFQYSNNRYTFSNMTNNTFSKYGFQPRWYNFSGYTGANGEFLSCIPGICAIGKQPLLTVYSNIANPGVSTFTWYFYETNRIFPVEPETPSGDISIGGTGTITNNSGDTTGKIDLSGIEQGIGNIQNQISGDTQKVIENQNQNSQTIVNTISGEVGKITSTLTNQPNLNNTNISSGDIESSLGFDFMADPYANFWYELTNGLSVSLTGSVRQLPIDWLGYQGVFDLDILGFNYPASFRLILTSISTVSMVWLLVKWWKIIIDKLTSGNMDEVLAMNEEERYY